MYKEFNDYVNTYLRKMRYMKIMSILKGTDIIGEVNIRITNLALYNEK